MKPTPREVQAVRSLAESILELLVAMEEGRESRRDKSPREEVAVRVEHVHPPAPQVPATPAPPMSREDETRHLMTVREASEYLSIGTRTIWTLMAPRGPLPTVRFGRAIRFKVKDLDDFVTRSRVKPRKD